MRNSHADPKSRYLRDGVSIPRIWLAVAVSLLVHALALWQWKSELRMPSEEKPERGRSQGELTVQLAPHPSPTPSPPRPAAPPLKIFEKPRPPAPRVPQRRPAPPQQVAPPPAPPVIARRTPDAQAPSQAPSKQPAPVTPRAPQQDFSAALEARRRARTDQPVSAAPPESVDATPPAEDENARANRIAAANLGTDTKPNFGADPRRGGGVFTIRRVAYDYAEFLFFGWNKDIRRNTAQVIEVRKGNESNIRIAVVRRMIAIIREHEQGDFVWESPRLGRKITLSARARDNAGLEAFMLREFFEDDQRR